MSIGYIFQGFLFGLAYVAPIGAQNMYVINAALHSKRKDGYKIVLTTIFFDITLAVSCFLGMGLLLERFEILNRIVLGLGAIALIYVAISLLKSKPQGIEESKENEGRWSSIFQCFAVTWLNPQAIIDGTLLLGGIRASLAKDKSYLFITGSSIASIVWFTGLFTIIWLFKDKFNEKVLKVLNIICGVIILFYGIKLGYSLIR